MTDHKISQAQLEFLLRRHGNEMTSDQAEHYLAAHHKAVAAGHGVDSKPYFKTIAEHVDRGSQPARREQPAQPKPSGPRYDGASVPKPKHVGGGDEFQKLRARASNGGRYGRKA